MPSIGLPSEVGDAFAGVSSMSLAVAEWIIDPRQVLTVVDGRWLDQEPTVDGRMRFNVPTSFRPTKPFQ